MSLWHRLTAWLKADRPSRVASLMPPPSPPAGWWRSDPAEQLRHYHS